MEKINFAGGARRPPPPSRLKGPYDDLGHSLAPAPEAV